jgi:hypothetical protein
MPKAHEAVKIAVDQLLQNYGGKLARPPQPRASVYATSQRLEDNGKMGKTRSRKANPKECGQDIQPAGG